jgi:hypothetical protein
MTPVIAAFILGYLGGAWFGIMLYRYNFEAPR